MECEKNCSHLQECLHALQLLFAWSLLVLVAGDGIVGLFVVWWCNDVHPAPLAHLAVVGGNNLVQITAKHVECDIRVSEARNTSYYQSRWTNRSSSSGRCMVALKSNRFFSHWECNPLSGGRGIGDGTSGGGKI